MSETCVFNRATSVLNVEISSAVLDRMVRAALRRRGGGGPVAWFVANAVPESTQTSERTEARSRESLIRRISDEIRRWSNRPVPRGMCGETPPRRQSPRCSSESFSSSN